MRIDLLDCIGRTISDHNNASVTNVYARYFHSLREPNTAFSTVSEAQLTHTLLRDPLSHPRSFCRYNLHSACGHGACHRCCNRKTGTRGNSSSKDSAWKCLDLDARLSESQGWHQHEKTTHARRRHRRLPSAPVLAGVPSKSRVVICLLGKSVLYD
jgi:hypothetical protein